MGMGAFKPNTMEWYVPITILPGVGLFILSTTNLLIALNNEIIDLKPQEDCTEIIVLKIGQLKKLSVVLVGLYLAGFAFLCAGIAAALWSEVKNLSFIFLVSGVIAKAISIFILIIYAFNAVKIRLKYLKI